MQKKYGPRGEIQGQPKYQLHKYKLDIGEQELVEIQGAKDSKIEFVSDQINHIEPLPFGGFLAFDLEFVYLYGEGSNICVDAKKLRRSMVVSAITKVDDYDPTTGATTQGKDFLRYLLGTEAGEVYMIAFRLEILRELTKGGARSLSQVKAESSRIESLLCIEFLGARLSCCSSLVYLGGGGTAELSAVQPGLIYYSSNTGDSYILQIESDRQ